MFIAGFVCATPHTQCIFNGKNKYRNNIEVLKERKVFFVQWLYCFKNYNNYVGNNEKNNKAVNDLIPFGFTQLGMQKDVYFFSGCMIHAVGFGSFKVSK